jgi:hypothetical protein
MVKKLERAECNTIEQLLLPDGTFFDIITIRFFFTGEVDFFYFSFSVVASLARMNLFLMELLINGFLYIKWIKCL